MPDDVVADQERLSPHARLKTVQCLLETMAFCPDRRTIVAKHRREIEDLRPGWIYFQIDRDAARKVDGE